MSNTYSSKRKLLLTSVFKPFEPEFGGGFFPYSNVHRQLTWAQGIFQFQSTCTQSGIDFIAENLEVPTTTLQYPTMSQFIKELKKGYDYVGISFLSATMYKMIPMAQAVRKYAPGSKIILGCFGTMLPDDILKQYADYICRGEGIRFMRELLNEPVQKPIQQPLITEQNSYLVPVSRTGLVFAGLGCPNECDFCVTSHYFKGKYETFLPDGRSIFDAIRQHRSAYPNLIKFWLRDEDFFINTKRARQFLEEIRRSDLPPLSIFSFASVKGLSQFSPSELVEMGIDRIVVGYEGKRAGFDKMKGKSYRDLFDDFRAHGINIAATVIIGLDYQTPEIIEEEFQDLMSLKPAACQFMIYTPHLCTPLYKRLEAEGRLRADIIDDPSKHDGTWLAFKHPHISQEAMRKTQVDLYHREFEILGPSTHRCVENYLNGYRNLKDHPSPRVRAKALEYKKLAHKCMITIPASRKYVSSQVSEWLEDLHARIRAETGDMTLGEKIMSKLFPIVAKAMDFKLRHFPYPQPKFTRKRYRM